ncbi:hypothetical protein [Brevibacillus sp. H7]|uniref:hypothetical protein n=1 Tax=Brevibacillus sp. H7 TaxID=3349138 RepID=UPI0038194232
MSAGAWRIALLFSVISLGSAYLNGYEWLRFFSFFGSWGTIGIVLTSIGISWFTYAILRFCHQRGLTSLHELFVHLFGSKLAPSFSVLVYVILLAYLGTVIGQQAVLQADHRYALLVVCSLCFTAFWLARRGMNEMVRAAWLLLILGLACIGLIFTEQRHVPVPSLSYQLNGYWILSACYYLALHLLLSVVALLPLITRLPTPAAIRMGIGLGGLFLFFMTMLGHAALLAYWHEIHASAIPLKEILSRMIPYAAPVHTLVSLGHSGLVLAALFYGLTVPVAERYDLQLTPMLLVMSIATAAFALFPLWTEAFTSMPYTAATYCGMLILAVYCWRYKV